MWQGTFDGKRVATVTCAAMIAVLSALAWLQDRWLEDLRQAQLVNLLSLARSSGEAVRHELESVLVRTAAEALQTDGAPPKVFSARYRIELSPVRRAQRVDAVSGHLQDVPWPAFLPADSSWITGSVLPSVPALVFPDCGRQPRDAVWSVDHQTPPVPLACRAAEVLVIDEQWLSTVLLPECARRFLPGEELGLSISMRRHQAATAASGEVILPLLRSSRSALAGVLAGEAMGPQPRGMPFSPPASNPASGVWDLVIAHRSGSFEQAVRTQLWRQRLFSAGALTLLLGTALLLLYSVRLARRVGREQVLFLAGLSHELKTPLAVIGSAGENLAEGLVSETEHVRDYGRAIRRHSQRLSSLLTRMIDLAALFDRRALRCESLAVAPLVHELLDAQTAQDRVECDLPLELPSLFADRVLLSSALQSLLQNALHYGGSPLRISASPQGRIVRISFDDQGPGMTPEEQRRACEPFFRGEHGTAQRREGAGLGLYLAQAVARAHGGRLSIDSNPGRGTRLALLIPAAGAR